MSIEEHIKELRRLMRYCTFHKWWDVRDSLEAIKKDLEAILENIQ